jgi:heat shock protein HslJ
LIAGLAALAALVPRSGRPLEPLQPAAPATHWQLQHILVGEKIERPPSFFAFNGRPQIQFVSRTEFVGYDGCNSFVGVLEFSEERHTLHLSETSYTQIACGVVVLTGDDYAQMEPGFLQALTSAGRFEINSDGSQLRLYFPEAQTHVLVLRPSSEPFPYRVLR